GVQVSESILGDDGQAERVSRRHAGGQGGGDDQLGRGCGHYGERVGCRGGQSGGGRLDRVAAGGRSRAQGREVGHSGARDRRVRASEGDVGGAARQGDVHTSGERCRQVAEGVLGRYLQSEGTARGDARRRRGDDYELGGGGGRHGERVGRYGRQ